MAGILDGAAKYHVHQRVGAGGMGIVHLGTMVSPAGTRNVAIKQLLPKGPGAQTAERIVSEARLVFQLTHGNICQVLDLAVSDEGTFIVMEYVDGCDLKTLLRAQEANRLPVAAAVYIASEVALALDYAHRKRDERGRALFLVHGDVTPQNILLSREGEVKLADFGIARALGSSAASAAPGNRLVAGTPGFMAPETLRGENDQRADIYSLGVTLAVALSGVPPEQIDDKTLNARPEVSPELAGLVRRAIAPRCEDRFATASEMQEALSLHLAHRFPGFNQRALAELVKSGAREPTWSEPENAVALASLTGTATFLSAMAPPMSTQSRSQTNLEQKRTRSIQKRSAHRVFSAAAAALVLFAMAVGFFKVTSLGRNASARPPEAPPLQPLPANPAPQAPSPSSTAPLKAAKAETTAPPTPPVKPKPRSMPRPIKAAPKEAAGLADDGTKMGYLTVHSEPWGAVYVDGRRFGDQTPLYRAPIAAGKRRVAVYNPVRKAFSPPREVVIRAGEQQVIGIEW